ncbi:MAG: YigZ family protein [Clostridia bacterium]|nr:YigZ family protein [Clostridia bacterium]
MQEYKTPASAGQDEFTEKRSRFIGYVCPVSSEQEALDFIASIKSRHWDARHNVYAYRLRDGGITRYSDDGEPSGTAGMPVLNVIQKNDLTDCAIVVTRYFGGILLGGGGLVRAYSHAAAIGITAAGIAVMRLCMDCSLLCDYNQYGKLQSLIPACGGKVIRSDFGAAVTMDFVMTQEALDSFTVKLADATGGSVTVSIGGKRFIRMNEDDVGIVPHSQ